MKSKKGQVSLETLLLAAVIIMISTGIFSQYLQIMDTTLAMQATKLETLKQIEAEDTPHFIEIIEYKVNNIPPPSTITLCISTLPGNPNQMTLDQNPIKQRVAAITSFEEADITISHNNSNPCS